MLPSGTYQLSENLDHVLRKFLGPHEVFTVAYMGWSGLQNGDLLAIAERTDIKNPFAGK